jgi:hypothetical protein
MTGGVRPGDVVGRSKGMWTHIGVVDAEGVWHVAPGEPFRRTSWGQFAQGREVKLLHRPERVELPAIRRRAREWEGTQWSVWRNCQDVGWKVATDVAHSPGRVGTLVGLGLLALAGLAAPAAYRALTTADDASGYRRDHRGRFA